MPEDRTMPKRKRHVVAWILLSLLLLLVAAVGCLYIPGVLGWGLKKLSPTIEESSGLRISAEHLRLSFPLHLKAERLLILTPQDTMVAANRADVNVSPWALFAGNLRLNDATLQNAIYKMGGRDSMYLSARIDQAQLNGNMKLNFSEIDLDRAVIDGGRVHLVIGPDTTTTPKDTTATALKLALKNIELHNVLYVMYMATTNDTIAADIDQASVADGTILTAQDVEIAAPAIAVKLNSALYGQHGAEPPASFDPTWITLHDGAVNIHDFHMLGTALTLPIDLDVKDIAGLPLSGSGTFSMDSTMLAAQNFNLLLNGRSRIKLDAMMGLDTIAPAPVNIDLSTNLYVPTIAKAYPLAAPLLAPLPTDVPLTLRAVASGTMDNIKVDTLGAAMPGIFFLQGGGTAANFSDIQKLKADVSLQGELVDSKPFAKLIPPGVKLPPLKLNAKAKADAGNFAANLTATTAKGRLALNGTLQGSAPNYNFHLMADNFPVAAFMPNLGVGAVSAKVKASGHGFNLLHPGATMDATAQVTGVDYNGYHISGIDLSAKLQNADLQARLNSTSPAANLGVNLAANLQPRNVTWQLNGDIRRLDLHALGLSDSILSASMQLQSQGYATVKLDSISGDLMARNVRASYGRGTYRVDSLSLLADAGCITTATLGSTGLTLDFHSPQPLDSVITRFTSAAALANEMIARKNFLADTLVATMPPFALNLAAGPGNPAEQFLNDISFQSLSLHAVRDTSLRANARLLALKTGSLSVDTISLRMGTYANRLFLDTDMDNRPGTFDEFAHVCLKGAVRGNQGRFFIEQKNIRNVTGYRLGFLATITDTISGIQFTPYNPIIAYKDWKINPDNYLAVYPAHKRIYANIDASGAGSRLQLHTSRSESADTTDAPNVLSLKVSDIHIQDWLEINPFAPPVAGDVSADLSLSIEREQLSGSGTASLANFKYGKKKVGDFDLDLDVATNYAGAIHANVGLDVNGHQVLTALGAINDTMQAKPVNMFVRVKEFPLNVANAFLPADMAQLSGSLNGRMSATGTFQNLDLNGNLNFRQASVRVGMLGSTYTLDSVAVPVDSNLVRFDDFDIWGANANPLKINGTVNINKPANPGIDLSAKAANMQFVNSKKGKGVDIYGKGFIDLDATVRGNLDFLNVNANLAILPQTNLTYQMSDAAAMVGLQPDDDVVRFVNFADTAQVAQADTVQPSGTLMALTALLDIRQGSQFTVNLSSDGSNRAYIKGSGILDYTMNPALPDGRLTGRFTIDGGNFRYSLPVISTVDFDLTRGSYVAFTGPVLNPTLNVHATQTKKANVTSEGQNSRLINFIVGLAATGTLEKMDVAFDMSTNDDITVENELQAMSATQRANKAMNLMLYGTYASGSTSASANLSGLYGFLTSQLNSWAAQSIKGVDLSFGVDQYDRTFEGSKSTTTQYSYKVSKSLFNDRFKIVVGGNYSTDADADENFAENLISDISFEYMLNQSGSMYVRLFRHTGYESILEGEVTQTGVGFVVRRRVRRLADIFNFIKASKQ